VAELPAAFIEALEAERDAFNVRFALRVRAGSRLDGGAFLRHLQQHVAPLIGQIAAIVPERAKSALAALYDVSLDLFAASLLGPDSKMPWIERVWSDLLPPAAELIARQPQHVAASLCNAVFQIASQRGTRPQQWIVRMQQVAPHCQSVGELLEAGKVAAWLAGMVQFRQASLAAAAGLRPQLAALVLGRQQATSRKEIEAVLSRLREHPWMTVEGAAKGDPEPGIWPLARAGAFSGFGGLFLRPPIVWSDDQRLLVSDGKSQWELIADAYGAWFRRIGDAPASQPRRKTAASIDRHGTIQWLNQSLQQPHLAKCVSLAASGQTLAATIPTSHHVFLFSSMGPPL
jgi:hypothetical protein